MSNMSYIRFENTLADLVECCDALTMNETELSDSERAAAIGLIKVCASIVAHVVERTEPALADIIHGCEDDDIEAFLRTVGKE